MSSETSADPRREVRVRFAPSPTGTLHVGSARTALYNYLFARHNHGRFILRIEDTDVARSREEFERSIMQDLAWLGLDWDEGPKLIDVAKKERGDGHRPVGSDAGKGDYGPYRQSQRAADGFYRTAAKKLVAEGKAYYCFCSQARLDQAKAACLAAGDMPKYDRSCANLTGAEVASRLEAGETPTIRFRVPDFAEIAFDDIIHGHTVFSTDVFGDFIIIRSDGGASYNFAVVVDDISMKISHVIRGEDHLTNTARQLLVFEALGERPPLYAHHSLIMGADGAKLSKRHGATSVGEFREMGYLPAAIINYLALLSWSSGGGQEKLSREQMVEEFQLDGLSRSPAIFDIQKLNWLNGLHIRDLSHEELHRLAEPFLGETSGLTEGQLAVAEAAVQSSLVTLADIRGQIAQFFDIVPLAESEGADEIREPGAQAVLNMAIIKATHLDDAIEFTAAAVDEMLDSTRKWLNELKAECKQRGLPAKTMYRTLRIALTGRTSGPELPFLLAGLGRENIRMRLEAAREFAGKAF